VSHFVYLAYAARRDKPVRRLELELQAEVDKFAAGVLGVAPRGRADPAQLRRRIFDELPIDPDLDEEEEERYLTAWRLARRYTVYLERRYLVARETRRFLDELRGFYRLGLPEKIGHILSSG
jgi:hypothetical protein